MEREAKEAADEAARKWWSDLEERSLGTMHIREWGYLWLSVMIRRVIAKHTGPSLAYRSLRRWRSLIAHEIEPWQWDWERDFHLYTIADFFNQKDSPWSIAYHPGNKYAILHVATLDEDIEYARKVQLHRMNEEKRWRDWADRKRADTQQEARRPQLVERH